MNDCPRCLILVFTSAKKHMFYLAFDCLFISYQLNLNTTA